MVRTDVAQFGAFYRTDKHRLIIREAQYEITKHAIAAAGIPWDTCRCEDRGDGVLIVVPPAVSTELLVHPFVESLVAGLGRHNARADIATSIQLRAALHVGPVTSDPHGVSGEVIIHVARLVDSPVLKERLAKAEAHLGFITSPFVYDSVIRQRPGRVEPAEYEKVDFWSKGSLVTGWMYLGGGNPDGSADGSGLR